jgi:hypothetical protein
MALPEIKRPLFTMTMPSTKKEVTFRPFLVGEEKILLMAQESGDDRDIIRAIKQILTNVIVSESFSPRALTTFDLEYMFLKLRAKSVSNIMEMSYIDNEDQKKYDFQINLDDIEVTYPEGNWSNKIKASDDIGITLRYPTVELLASLDASETETEMVDQMVRGCIASIYDAENVYLADEQDPADLAAFIDKLDPKTYKEIRSFFDGMPQVIHTINYKNSLGNDRKIELRTLKDFFTWA